MDYSTQLTSIAASLSDLRDFGMIFLHLFAEAWFVTKWCLLLALLGGTVKFGMSLTVKKN